MHGEVEEKSSIGAVYSLYCKNLAPPTHEILLKFSHPRFSSPNLGAAFSIAAILPINIVLPIQLGALEPVQFIKYHLQLFISQVLLISIGQTCSVPPQTKREEK